MKNKTYFIIDFDSTFVTVECLDELAAIALKNNPGREKILKEIKNITTLGMEGKLSFPESLQKRLELFKANKNHIEKLIKSIKNNITPSVKNNKEFFEKYAESVYIISGGFKEYILPVVKPFGIKEDHVLANTFTFDKKGYVTGFDTNNLLSKEGGKVLQIEKLGLQGTIYIVGDGYTDYQIKEKGYAEKFFAYTENVKRASILDKADYVSASFDEVLFRLRLPRALSYPKTLMKVLLLENIHPRAKELFEKEGYNVELLQNSLDTKTLSEALRDISVLGIRSKTAISEAALVNANKLLTIGVFGIGVNHIELRACARKGIAVFNAPFSNTRSVVELVLGNIIMLNRRAIERNTKMHQGVWEKSAKDCHEIRGRKLGIIGYGNIGSQLSVLAENLGMEVYFYNHSEKLVQGNAKQCRSLKELLKIADIVTVHVDGRKENENLIGEDEFALMKHGVLFLNLSRGSIVNVDALVKYLKNGKVAGAAIDVFPREPKSNDEIFRSPLQGFPNVILTPHIGAATEEGQKNIAEFVPGKLTNFINTGNTTLCKNLPNILLPELVNAHRFIHIHNNKPGILAQINNVFAKNKINIEGQYLKTNEDIGYVITDVNKDYSHSVKNELKSIPETIRVRVLY